jgi:hypothetical protein
VNSSERTSFLRKGRDVRRRSVESASLSIVVTRIISLPFPMIFRSAAVKGLLHPAVNRVVAISIVSKSFISKIFLLTKITICNDTIDVKNVFFLA